jgi:hypothetical protein
MRQFSPFRRVASLLVALFLALQGGSNAVCDALYHAAADGHGASLTHVVHISPADAHHVPGGDETCVFCQALNHLGFTPTPTATLAPPIVRAVSVHATLVRRFLSQDVNSRRRARAPPFPIVDIA